MLGFMIAANNEALFGCIQPMILIQLHPPISHSSIYITLELRCKLSIQFFLGKYFGVENQMPVTLHREITYQVRYWFTKCIPFFSVTFDRDLQRFGLTWNRMVREMIGHDTPDVLYCQVLNGVCADFFTIVSLICELDLSSIIYWSTDWISYLIWAILKWCLRILFDIYNLAVFMLPNL